MKHQEQKRSDVKVNFDLRHKAEQELLEQRAGSLFEKINDRMSRRTDELNRQVSITREKNQR